jgi:hypothetical protein
MSSVLPSKNRYIKKQLKYKKKKKKSFLYHIKILFQIKNKNTIQNKYSELFVKLDGLAHVGLLNEAVQVQGKRGPLIFYNPCSTFTFLGKVLNFPRRNL